MNESLNNAADQVLLQTGVQLDDGRDSTNRKNMLLLIQLRWIAVIGQMITIGVVQLVLDISLPLLPMAWLLAALVVLNLLSLAWLKRQGAVSSRALLHALMLDVLGLTVQLYLSGGATNPFIGLYLLQVTLGAVLLNAYAAWSLVSLAAAGLLLLTQMYQPLDLTQHAVADLVNLQVVGMLVCYGLDAALLVLFITRITRNLRQRDEHLAELKQRAAEEDHIVRMGLLASGAAHELGTPLASVAVILGDWRRMPTVADQPELMADIDDMQAAVQRCKTIVTGILMSTGETRGEAPELTTVNDFLDDTVNEWHTARPAACLHYHNHFGVDVSVVSDSTLQQAIANLLDNANEASPEWIELKVLHDHDSLVLQVADAGPGFAPQMLSEFGKPYRSTKGRLGSGLGLFLVVNVVRKLGGTVTARNRAEGGAVVTVVLPLELLRMDDESMNEATSDTTGPDAGSGA
ncbi:MAG: ATP-binding protein [Steroidobacteraceae bacterium]